MLGTYSQTALSAAAFWVPEKLLGLFTNDPEVIQEGVSYLSVITATQ